MNTDVRQLLPCPFCGGDPVEQEHPPHDHPLLKRMGIEFPDHLGSFTVECPKCGVGLIQNTAEEVRSAWNRRAALSAPEPAAPPAGVREALVAAANGQKPEGKTITYRGSGSDLAKDVLALLDQVELKRFMECMPAPSGAGPVAMLLYCPRCQMQHVDAADTEEEYTRKLHESAWWELGGEKPARWTNPPHATHTCKGCGLNWRPSNAPTVGVAAIPVAELGSEAKHIERMEATNPTLYVAPSSSAAEMRKRLRKDISKVLQSVANHTDPTLWLNDKYIRWGLVEQRLHMLVDDAIRQLPEKEG